MKQFNPFNFTIQVDTRTFKGIATPYSQSEKDGVPFKYFIRLYGDLKDSTFDIECSADGWKADANISQDIADAIGDFILKQYE